MSDHQAHDPNAGPLDYSIDFSNWLSGSDTISAVEWSILPTGPDLTDDSISGGVVYTKVSGGTNGYVYRLTAHVTSANDLEDDRSIILRCGQL